MQVSNPNNIKIYNLSHGKSLPEFIGEKKKRALLKKDVDLRRRIELIQDFGMPTVSTSIRMSADQQYIFATGTYKPRVRCFDVNDLSLKFERCLDCEAVTFDVLSEDYSKLVFLLSDRNVELHTQQGKHFCIRIPKFGRDLAYHPANCDLMLVGAGPEIYRLNLDQGRFLKSFETNSPELTTCEINKDHHLVMAGGMNGRIECWDPRSKCRAGILDCVPFLMNLDVNEIPSASSLKFKSSLHLAVGTSTGQVLMFDIRNNRPFITKDHHYDLPINSIAFNTENEVVISADSRAVKLWNERTGDPITAVEMESDINDLHLVANTGLFFLANESPKIHTYFIPMLGPAPRWCSFLDNLTEEMEENPSQEIYDDYKFLTQKDIESLGLSNLIGTSLLRAYMHGYFVDMRLYHKALSIANPFAYKEYRKKKIAEKIEESRTNRVHVKKLPKVNKNLANRLMARAEEENAKSGKKKKMKKEAANLLEDARFKAIFEDPSFQVDEESEEFKMLNPVVSRRFEKMLNKSKKEDEEDEEKISEYVDGEMLSEDEGEKISKSWIRESSSGNKSPPKKKRASADIEGDGSSDDVSGPRMFEIKSDTVFGGKTFNTLHDLEALAGEEAQQEHEKMKNTTLEERIKAEEEVRARIRHSGKQSGGGRESTFRIKDSKSQKRSEDEKQHRDERREVRRPAHKLHRQKARKHPFSRR